MSRKTPLASQIEGDEELSPGTLAYLGERSRNAIYSFVLGRFIDEERKGLTKAKLARRLGKKPEVITRLLGAPGNWTIDTIAELLVGIGREELEPTSRPLVRSKSRNVTTLDLINSRNVPDFQWVDGSSIIGMKTQDPGVAAHAKKIDGGIIFGSATV